MSLLKRMFRPRPNGVHEIEMLRDAREQSLDRLTQSVRRLARTAESISKQKKDDDFQKLLHRFRVSEGHD